MLASLPLKVRRHAKTVSGLRLYRRDEISSPLGLWQTGAKHSLLQRNLCFDPLQFIWARLNKLWLNIQCFDPVMRRINLDLLAQITCFAARALNVDVQS